MGDRAAAFNLAVQTLALPGVGTGGCSCLSVMCFPSI